jgi:hypothetical protein
MRSFIMQTKMPTIEALESKVDVERVKGFKPFKGLEES